jgi:hypothetical protein
MFKYLDEAKENGFEDYKISDTIIIEWDKKFLGST